MKPNIHLGGNAWSQPWHAMHRRLLQNGVRTPTARGGVALDGELRGDSWLVRARHRGGRSATQARRDAL